MAMAARRPAPPPPTISTSCAARTTLSLTPPLLVRQHLPVVVDDHPVAAAVVELLPGGPAPAGVAEVLGYQTLVVLGQVLLTAVPVSARCEPRLESGGGCTHGPPPLCTGTVTSGTSVLRTARVVKDCRSGGGHLPPPWIPRSIELVDDVPLGVRQGARAGAAQALPGRARARRPVKE